MMTAYLAVGFIAVAMAVGRLSKNRCLRGSCGGGDVVDSEGHSLRCGAGPLSDRPDTEASTQTTMPPVTRTTEPVT